MLKNLEHHEHAEHMVHGHGSHEAMMAEDAKRNQMAALLVAVLAAGLAVTETAARTAEIRVYESAIFATDSWGQYQAKSVRGTLARNLADLTGVISADPALADRRQALVTRLLKDQESYEKDPKDGKEAVAERAREFERERDHALEQTHSYHNSAATLELGIVLSTASAIIKSRLLIMLAFGLGIIGGTLGILGLVAPEFAAF